MNMCGRGDKDIFSISESLGIKNLGFECKTGSTKSFSELKEVNKKSTSCFYYIRRSKSKDFKKYIKCT